MSEIHRTENSREVPLPGGPSEAPAAGTGGVAGAPPPLDRLARAIDAFLAHDAASGSAAEVLARHGDLKDLLAPLFGAGSTEDGGADPGERTLGDFRLLRELGRGGMGIVHEAWQISLDRRVAVKVLPPGPWLHAAQVARFQREALTAGRLRHDGIVEVHAVGCEGDTHFFAMELIDGVSLDRLLQDPLGVPAGQLPEELLAPLQESAREGRGLWNRAGLAALVEVCASVAEALHHAHVHGVVHRDVKPSNIVVRTDGRPILTDFGLAFDTTQPSLTRTGHGAGTPHYMAPEQVRAQHDRIGPATDVFALGATLYELMTQRKAFPGHTPHEIVGRILDRDPIDPQRLHRQLPADLAAIAMRALEKRPEQRYPSAQALAEDLRAFLAFRPVTARRVGRTGRFTRWVRRSRLRASLVAITALATVATAALSVYLVVQWPKIAAGDALARTREMQSLLFDAELAMEDRRYRAADAAFAAAIALVPDDPEAVHGRVKALLHLRQIEAAEAVLARAREVGFPRDLAQRILVVVHEQAGRTEQAEKLLSELEAPRQAWDYYLAAMRENDRAALSGDPVSGKRALELLRRAVLTSTRPTPLFYSQWAKLGALSEDRAACHDSAAALLALWPDSARACLWAGAALARVDPARALGVLENALRLGLDHALVHFETGVALEKLGRLKEAVEAFRRSLARNEHRELTAHGLGYVLLKIQDFEGAERVFRRAIAQGGEASGLCNGLGAALEKLGDVKGAETQYRRAVELAPHSYTARTNLGTLLLAQRRLDEASIELEAALGTRTKDLRSLVNLAWVRMHQNRLDEAEKLYRQAIAAGDRSGIAHANLGRIKTLRGDATGAIADYTEATELNADLDDAWHGLAWCLLLDSPERDPERALQSAERAATLSRRRNAGVLATLAEAQWATGKHDAARATVTEALALLDPKNPAHKESGLRLRRLQRSYARANGERR